jgi:hypothetical protein
VSNSLREKTVEAQAFEFVKEFGYKKALKQCISNVDKNYKEIEKLQKYDSEVVEGYEENMQYWFGVFNEIKNNYRDDLESNIQDKEK